LLVAALIAPSAIVLSTDVLGPSVDGTLTLKAPASDLLHPAMSVARPDQYPVPLLPPGDQGSVFTSGRYEPGAELPAFLHATILKSDVAVGDGRCQPELLRVAEVETDAGRFALVLAPEGSSKAVGSDFKTSVAASFAAEPTRGHGLPPCARSSI
jgi:hypothetical protein